MKSVKKFLSELNDLDVELWAEGDRLRCNAPKGMLTPALRTELAERKAEILKFLLKANLGSHSTLELIPSVPRDGDLSLSFAQQRLWFLDQLEPSNPFYNIPAAVRLTGPFNVAVLEQSLNEIVRRHETLRTTFEIVNGAPTQAIAPTLTVPLPIVDLQGVPEEKQSAKVLRLVNEEAQHPFDLSEGPLLRVTLLRLGAEEHVLLVTMHHIVSDGWSMGIFIREFAILYEAFSMGAPSPLPEQPVQYADFAHWQRQWLTGEVLETQINYWKEQLAGAPPVLELPTDCPRPPVQTYRGTHYSFVLPKTLTEKLNGLSQREGGTLFMTLLATFVTLLSRYSNQEDIVVGSPIANRNRREIESLIGFFVNTLVLRTNLKGNPSFLELLQRVQQVALDAYAHQDLPFEQLVDALQPERNLSHSPLFQVMFILQNAPMEKLELPGLTLTPLEMESITAKFDLTLSMEETDRGLRGTLEYNSDLFDRTTMTKMAKHFQTLLEAIVANPQQRISELPLLSEAERHQLLVEWNDTQAKYPQDQCIHQLFEAQVERLPDAMAVVFEDQELTYRKLNARANQLAHYLQARGVGPEVLVGICVERSLEMVVGLLGILKVGGAYVPLDPHYPQERLSYMLADSGIEVLLTQRDLLKSLPSHTAQVVCLDRDWEAIEQLSQENLDVGVCSENLAYAIYTSGSTGKPKGVLVAHQGLLNLVFWHQVTFAITSSDRATQLAGTAFDASAWELWPYLSAGASIHLLKTETTVQPQVLQDWLISQKITVTFVPTPLLESLLSLEWPSSMALRIVLTGGDKLHQYPSTSLPFRVINNYGPTENTVVTTSGLIVATEPTNLLPSIGRPIANTQIYILDKHLQPVPIGVAGELYIGGDGLARGYLNRPELTQEKFIPNPFMNSERLYKTGDLARYLPDGNIQFLGRLDHQVKIRGFRIELGEIEAVLTAHPEVREAVAIACEDQAGNKRLVAYVVSNQEQPTTSELRNFLKQKLPDYMVPSAFVLLDILALTPNGKVDRRVLPAPDRVRDSEVGFVAPRTPAEEILAAIWTEVLGLEQVGIHDKFFELGGDSILSIQVIARANQSGLGLTPKQLFQHQTIAELAAVASKTVPVQAEQGLVTGTVPLTSIQQWFFEQNLPEPHHFNQSVLLEVAPDLKRSLLEQVIQQLLVHHDALRLRFVQDGKRWQQVNDAPDETVPLRVVDLSAIPSGEQQAAIETTAAELQASLNLSEGPILRAALFHLGFDKPGRLLLVIHHLVVDGVSWRILLEDLSKVYQQLSRGSAVQLPPKTTSFQFWAQRLTEYGQSEALATELDYWLAQSWSGVAPLPLDHPSGRGDNAVGSAANVSVSLSVEQTRALMQEVPSAYNTKINDVLLTALVQSFAQWTGKRFLLIDLEAHGREELFEEVDLSRTVGWFTTVFPVLLELEEDDHPGEALKSVKEQLRRIPNQGISYGILRYLSQKEATRQQLEALPQAEVIFNYLGQFDQVLSESSVLQVAKESSGQAYSALANRSHLLEVNGFVASGRLQLDWTYSKKVHQRATVERLAQDFIEVLQALISHCQSPDAGGYTPSDFPEAELSQEELDELVTQID